MGRLADLDAVTLDANGTLVELVDPVPELERALKGRGVDRPVEAIRRAFEAEGALYASRSLEAHEPSSLATLQRECTGVFLGELGADSLDPGDFSPTYVEAMQFELLPQVRESLRGLQRSGLVLAVVANFDLTLRHWLGRLGLGSTFSSIVTPGDAGAAKPDPRIFRLALEQLGVAPSRALHIGDGLVDEEGALAAGMQFARAPVAHALESWA